MTGRDPLTVGYWQLQLAKVIIRTLSSKVLLIRQAFRENKNIEWLPALACIIPIWIQIFINLKKKTPVLVWACQLCSKTVILQALLHNLSLS